MAHEKNHPIAGIAFLILVGGLIVWAAKSGIEASRAADVKADIIRAVMVGDQGDLQASHALLKALVEAHPENTGALYMLASVEARLGRLDEADQLYARVLDRDPNDWESVAERAGIAKKKGNLDAGLAMLMQIPAGKGHIEERLMDEVWYDLHGDDRLKPLLEKHQIRREGGVRSAKTSSTSPGGQP